MNKSDFNNLKKTWYDILKRDNFNDIELGNGKLKHPTAKREEPKPVDLLNSLIYTPYIDSTVILGSISISRKKLVSVLRHNYAKYSVPEIASIHSITQGRTRKILKYFKNCSEISLSQLFNLKDSCIEINQ